MDIFIIIIYYYTGQHLPTTTHQFEMKDNEQRRISNCGSQLLVHCTDQHQSDRSDPNQHLLNQRHSITSQSFYYNIIIYYYSPEIISLPKRTLWTTTFTHDHQSKCDTVGLILHCRHPARLHPTECSKRTTADN